MVIRIVEKGGEGSGNFDHEGHPGMVGGSGGGAGSSEGAGSSKLSDKDSVREKEVLLPRGTKFRVISNTEKITVRGNTVKLIKVVAER